MSSSVATEKGLANLETWLAFCHLALSLSAMERLHGTGNETLVLSTFVASKPTSPAVNYQTLSYLT